jgi:NADH-quinone oxidoreductase subunit C
MTVSLHGREVAQQVGRRFPQVTVEASDQAVLVSSQALYQVLEFLKDSPEFNFDYFSYVTAVDYYDYFELVYQLTSMKHNHTVVIKTRCQRNNPVVPSVVKLWRGAEFQEREVYDLMGIRFDGHPDLKRIALWEGFQGHPLRKDYLRGST